MIAIYARQSVDKKDSISIESQIDFCKKEVEEEDYKVYKDKGYSGKNIDRPAFKEMMRDIKKNAITKVVAYKLDRISRSILDFNNLLEEFKKHNIEFVSVTEKFDTSTPMGKAMVNIVVTFAQLEREQIAQRVKDNYYERGKTGRFLGGKVPLGYTNTKVEIQGKKVPTLVINKEEALLIEKMFNMYAYEDISLSKISDYLNEQGLKSAKGTAWDSGKISRIIKNALYVKADVNVYNYYKNLGVEINNPIEDFIGTNGCFVYGKRDRNENRYTNLKDHKLSIGLHEGIVDADTFLKCQYKLSQNQQITRSGSGKHTWLTGLTKCGYCGYSMSAVVNSSGKYFNCRGKTNMKICNGHSRTIKVEEIENIVETEILNRLEELSKVKIKMENSNSKKIKSIETEIKILDENIEKLLDKILESNDITIKYINKKVEELDNKKTELRNELNRITLEGSNNSSLEEVLKDVDKIKNLNFDKKKSIAKSLIDKILIRDDEIDIQWKVFNQ